MLTLLMLAALLFSPPASPTPETCDAIHALVGGELVAWVGYPQGWELPSDLKKSARVDFAEGGIWQYYSSSEQSRYLWVFLTYDQSTGANGEHMGAHEFCGPYRVSDHD